MNLERDEMAILLACVCGFVGGCGSGFPMARSRRKGFLWLGVTAVIGTLVWYGCQMAGEFRAGDLSFGPLFVTLIYAFAMAVLVFVLASLGCSLVWLILYLKDICDRRR